MHREMVTLEKIFIIENAKEYISKGQYNEALNLLAPILDPYDLSVSFEYAKSLYFLKRYEEAINILNILNDKYPNNNNILDILSKSYKETGKTENFIKILENSLNDTNIYFCLELANEYFLEKEYETAAKFYDKYLYIKKDDVDVAVKLVQIYNFIGNKKKAVEICSSFLMNKDVKNDKFLSNLFLNEREIAEEKIILKSNPRIMLVALTNSCNLKCPMCATRDQDNVWNISEKFKNYILKNLSNLELITWQGGEVFLYKGFEELFLEACKNKYLKQIIITNGLLLNKPWIDLMIQAGLLDLTISIDSIEKNIYEKIRCGAKFEVLIDNLKYLKQARQRQKSNITLTMRITVSDDNIYDLEKMIDFAAEYDFNVVILSALWLEQHNNKKYDFSSKSREELIKINELKRKIFDKSNKHKIKLINLLPNIYIEDFSNTYCEKSHVSNNETNNCNEYFESNVKDNETNNMPFCFRPWKQLATTVRREIRPECLCLQNVAITYECDDFEGIWNNKNMQEYRRKLINLDKSWCCEECINNTVSDEHKKFVCV